MKVEFFYPVDKKIHKFSFEWSGENNYQIKIDGEVAIQKLGSDYNN
jgi:hypothetical protein